MIEQSTPIMPEHAALSSDKAGAKFRDALISTLNESERQILRCAPPFDAQAEHEADLRYESSVDYESWKYDGPAEMEYPR